MRIKSTLLISLTISTGLSFGQNIFDLEMSNVSAFISDDGVFFNNSGTSNPEYEVPKGSDNHAIFAMGLWFGAEDINSQLHMSCQQYAGATDLFPGPIANDYNSTHYTTTYSNCIWVVNKADVDYHLANFGDVGYTVPSSFLDWPGNGNTAEGIAQHLAPYYDVDGDGFYDPNMGDYPLIEGDQAVYVIMNDAAAAHTSTNADPLGIEVHAMFFQDTDAGHNNKTLMRLRVYNRSTSDYYNFTMGNFVDFDLGNPMDDYFGCDSALNMMYVYNGDNSDEAGSTGPGYGSNPPVLGIKSLNLDLGAALPITMSPSTAVQYNNLMNGIQVSGAPYLDDQGAETKFVYSEHPGVTNGWSENELANPPGDRRAIMATEPMNFPAGSFICNDYSIMYHQNNTLDNIAIVDELYTAASGEIGFYSQSFGLCDDFTVGVAEQTEISFEVFPNPSEGFINLSINEAAKAKIFNLQGQLIMEVQLIEGVNFLETELSTGTYLLQVLTEKSTSSQTLVIK